MVLFSNVFPDKNSDILIGIQVSGKRNSFQVAIEYLTGDLNQIFTYEPFAGKDINPATVHKFDNL